MATTAFSYTVRMRVCPNCGAPLRLPLAGGEITCSFCNVVSLFTARREEPEVIGALAVATVTAANPGDERLARLAAQRDDKNRRSPYDITRAPPGLERWASKDLRGSGVLEALRAAWSAERAAGPVTMNEQARVFYLTHLVRSAAALAGKPEVDRAVSETALELFDDAGFRQEMRCMLAFSAVRAGDVTAAEGWLSTCDPRPEVLELDTDVRLARANVALARGDYRSVLVEVGDSHGSIPLAPAGEPVATLYRMHAFELLGDMQRARAEMTWMCSRSFMDNGGAVIAQVIIGVQAWRPCVRELRRSRATPSGERWSGSSRPPWSSPWSSVCRSRSGRRRGSAWSSGSYRWC